MDFVVGMTPKSEEKKRIAAAYEKAGEILFDNHKEEDIN